MFRWTTSSLLALSLAVLPAAVARASEFPAVDQAQVRLDGATRLLREADARLATTRTQQDQLAHRIASLKRLREENKLGDASTLEALLRQSIEGEKALAADAKRRDSLAADLDGTVAAGIRVVDAEIVKRKPSLQEGQPIKARQAAAAAINALLSLREEIRGRAAARSSGGVSAEEWGRYAKIAIGPLDGPRELREKADFVEDTRDKIRKKRELLAALVRDAQQERELTRHAARFRTETSLFDEESRNTRVARASSGRLAARSETTTNQAPEGNASADKTTADDSASQGGSARSTTPPEPTPSAGFQGDPSAAPALGALNSDAEATSNDTAAPPPAPPAQPAAGAATPVVAAGVSPALPKQLDPSTLLGLRIEDMANGETDLATLESLLRDLSKIDSYLDSRAAEIRARAKQLEQDEKKALGGKP